MQTDYINQIKTIQSTIKVGDVYQYEYYGWHSETFFRKATVTAKTRTEVTYIVEGVEYTKKIKQFAVNMAASNAVKVS